MRTLLLKIYRKKIAIILLMFCCSRSFSQTTFESALDVKSNLGNYPTFVFVKGYYFLFSEFTNSNDNIDLKIIKLDSSFNKVWEKNFKTEGSDLALRIIEGEDNYIYCLSDNSYFLNEKNNSSFILKIDMQGNEIWRKLLPSGAGDIKYLFNSLVFTGTDLINHKLKITKYDWKGNVLLEKSFYKSAYKGGSGNLLYDFSLKQMNDSTSYFQGTYYYIDNDKRDLQKDSLPINFLAHPKFKQQYFLLNKKFELFKKAEIKANQNLWDFYLMENSDWIYIANSKGSNVNNQFYLISKLKNKIDSIHIGSSQKRVNFHRLLVLSPYKIVITYHEDSELKAVFIDLKKKVKDELVISKSETNYHECRIVSGNKIIFFYPELTRIDNAVTVKYIFKSIILKPF